MNNPKTEEIVASLRGCSADEMDCKNCVAEWGRKYGYCFNTLRLYAADRLEEFERAMSRLGQFGKLFLDYDGCPRGARGRMGNATLIDETLSMEPITDVDENKWIPVQEEALRELCEAVQQRWIPVTERLPEDGFEVLVYTDRYGGRHEFAYYVSRLGAWCKNCALLIPNVTHWMPLPEPPKEDENEANA